MKILLISHANGARAWETALVARLTARGWGVATDTVQLASTRHPIDALLRLEARRFGDGPATLGPPPAGAGIDGPPDIIVDLTGQAPAGAAPTLTIDWSGAAGFADGLARSLVSEQLPLLVARRDGRPVAVARPMLSDRLWLSRAATDLLAGAIGLIEHCVARFALDQLTDIVPADPSLPAVRGGVQGAYLRSLLPGLARRAIGKLGRKAFDWQVGYRPAPAPGAVIGDARFEGLGFTVLPDDGSRFYADPFLYTDDAGCWLFVEAYPFAAAKGVIAVAALGADGRFGAPRTVLEERHHLSYPQVFAMAGEVYMLPESGAGRELVLYRARSFPDDWVRDTVLLEGVELGDMTLLVRDGRYWLFGTERRGAFGSVSDTMVVYMADQLRGPYSPHPLNPILIDRAAARPGGVFLRKDGRTYLPVQDGTESYGDGLGFAELLVLDETHVQFAPPVPIRPGPALDLPIHTFNSGGGYEVVDWFARPSTRRGSA